MNLFDIQTEGKSDREVALEGIEALRSFWTSIGAPARLADYKIGDENIELMADKTVVSGPFGNFKKLTKEDVIEIYRLSL